MKDLVYCRTLLMGLCIVVVAVTGASAAPTGLTAEIASALSGDPASDCDVDLGVFVCRIFVDFDSTPDYLVRVDGASITTTAPGGFFQVPPADSITEKVVETARSHGATGSTVIPSARGEGMKVVKTFFGLSLETQRDVVLLLVEEHMCRDILENIESAGAFETNPGSGIAFSIDVEDAVGVSHQVNQLSEIVEEEI